MTLDATHAELAPSLYYSFFNSFVEFQAVSSCPMPPRSPTEGPGVICIACCCICRREENYVDTRRRGIQQQRYEKCICDGQARRDYVFFTMGVFGPIGMLVSVGNLSELWAQVLNAVSAFFLVLACMKCMCSYINKNSAPDKGPPSCLSLARGRLLCTYLCLSSLSLSLPFSLSPALSY